VSKVGTSSGPDQGTSGPLHGVRVLDMSRVLAGPYAAMLLADLGAQVVKVERPGTGDDTRAWGPPFVTGSGEAESTYFLSINRGKYSVTLDLKDADDRPFLTGLLQWADVVIENFRPGVMDRLGLGDDALAEMNPRLVRLSISGFGDAGPGRDRVGYDQIVQAEGGLMSLTGDADGTPTKVGVPIADLAAGLFGVIGILAALVDRGSTQAGQRVITSLLAGQIGLHTFQATRFLVAGETPGPSGQHHPTVAPYGTFFAADGPIVLAIGNNAIWTRFAPLVGMDSDDPRFATNAARLANRSQLHEMVSAAVALRPVREWLSMCTELGVPAGEVKDLASVYTDPSVREQALVWSVDHSTLGRVELPGNPLQFSRDAIGPGLPPPVLGEHTEQVRAWILDQESAEARPAEQVIAAHD
jgi:crotonobetainyl-CoA:carnitine CoA-transferase CaiB-like acyl-CoA transferase